MNSRLPVVLMIIVLASVAAHAVAPTRTPTAIEYATVDVQTASACERLILHLQRDESPAGVETVIKSYFLMDVCSDPPVGTLLSFGEDVLIANTDFTVDRQHGTARLQASITGGVFGRVGNIDLTWKVNRVSNESFMGRGSRVFLSGPGEDDITRTTFKEVREDRSADVSGVAFDYSFTGLGGFGWRTLLHMEKL